MTSGARSRQPTSKPVTVIDEDVPVSCLCRHSVDRAVAGKSYVF